MKKTTTKQQKAKRKSVENLSPLTMYGRFSVYMRAVFKSVDMNDVLVM